MIGRFLFSALAACLVSAGKSAENPVSDTELWNEAVDSCNRGDVTNALRILRPLMMPE